MTGEGRNPGACQLDLRVAAKFLGVVRQFRQEAFQATSIRTLEALLAEAVEKLGFAYYALVDHGKLETPGALMLSNYPEPWQAAFDAGMLHRIDPVQQACRRRVNGFPWSRLEEITGLTLAQRSILDASKTHGIGEGFTVPFHLPGARAASCSFAVKAEASLPLASLPAAQLLAGIAYERARGLAGRKEQEPMLLSPRQRTCVALIAAGLTDHVIAERLGLSEETVTKYLNHARQRNGLARREREDRGHDCLRA